MVRDEFWETNGTGFKRTHSAMSFHLHTCSLGGFQVDSLQDMVAIFREWTGKSKPESTRW